MNVLKPDFLSKQKRFQEKRQKVVKTFFSGYHTISNVPPTSRCFKIPITNQVKSPKFPLSFSNIEESVEPSGIESGFSDGHWDLRCRKESTTSTSLEFRKLLEPFLEFRQEKLPKTGKLFPSFETRDETETDSIFQNQDTTEEEEEEVDEDEEGYEIQQKTIPQEFLSFNKIQQYNIFDLPPPKNQRSIEDVLNLGETALHDISEEVTPRLNNKLRSSSSSVFVQKTPKTKARKPEVSSSSKTTTLDSGNFILAITEGRGHARGEVGIAAMDPKRPHLVLCQISDSQRYVHSLTKMNVFDFVEVIVPNTFVDCATPNKLYSDIRSTFPKVTITSVQRRHFNETIGVDLIKQYSSAESASVMLLLRDKVPAPGGVHEMQQPPSPSLCHRPRYICITGSWEEATFLTSTSQESEQYLVLFYLGINQHPRKFYALSAAAALVKYIEFTQNVRLAPRSLKIEYQGTEDTMIIDLSTANLLELVMCANHPETNLNHSLLGVIKYCHTKGGVRLLRANILQPPCSLPKIETRLDCVTELVNNPLLLCSLEAAVSSFSNVEDLLNLCMHAPQQDGLRAAECQLKYTLLLKTGLELLPTLRTSLQEAKSDFFCEMRENLEDRRYTIILERILESVFENAKTVKGSVAGHLHGCFAIKAGINSLLDVAKKTYCEIVQEISDHVTSLRDTHNMPLRLAFSANRGFHIQYTLPPGQRNLPESSLPKEFILVKKSKTTFSFYTAELVALDQRSQHVLNEIKLMTNVILFQLLTDIRQHIGCLFNLCEYIAELDVLVSFAHIGSGTNYVRPRFGALLSLIDSRHPILDVIHDGEVTPNDVFAAEGKNFTILTGPNQSGKSIYIRQIALLQIMAQIGCYVPAKEATFRLTDRIFSRISFDDSIESNASTLMVEMRDIEYLRQNRTPRSLVIIDELCRGTSVEEGTSLAFAICEQLLDTTTFVFFTTHYLFLTKLEELYYNVTNYHFETKIETTDDGRRSLRFSHKRSEGPTGADSYGLQVAEMTAFPKDIVDKAKQISAKLSRDKKPCREVNGMLAQYKLALQLKSELSDLEPEVDWPKMESIILHFKQLYLNLTEGANSGEGGTGSPLHRDNSDVIQGGRSPCLIPFKGRSGDDPGVRAFVCKLARRIKRKYNKLRRNTTQLNSNCFRIKRKYNKLQCNRTRGRCPRN